MPDPIGRAVFVLTGPSASGKTTVARLLAQRFRRGVHLEGDFFRRAIVAGGEEVKPKPSVESLRQLRLRYELATSTADTYFDHGFTVVVEDVVAGPFLNAYVSLIRSKPLHVVVLMPSRDVIASREQQRETHGYHTWSVDQLYDLFENDTSRHGMWLDSSDLTPDETVDEILTRVGGHAARTTPAGPMETNR